MKKLNLASYGISESTGFLFERPSLRLPDYYASIQQAASVISETLRYGNVRSTVDNLPILGIQNLHTEADLALAHAEYATLASAYVWCAGEQNTPEKLPRNIAMPLAEISKRLGIRPILSHPTFVLSNYELLNPALPFVADNLRMITGKLIPEDDIDWFFLVTVQIEHDFARALPAIVQGVRCYAAKDIDGLIQCLRLVEQVTYQMRSSLQRMSERLHPHIFFQKIRPFLNGYNGPQFCQRHPPSGGLVFDDANDNKPLVLRGGSAAQSCLLHCLDAFLGVKHSPENQEFLTEMRDYMLPRHKDFIELIEQAMEDFNSFVRHHALDRPDLMDAYNNCIDAVTAFRSEHLKIVTRFIVNEKNKATGSFEGFKSLENLGTGGTGIMPFLKGVRSTAGQRRVTQPEQFVDSLAN